MGDPTAVNTERVADGVLRIVLEHQRRVPGGECTGDVCEKCLRYHLDQVQEAVEAGRPLEFVLPAFPAKSPNPAKVLGYLPDRAEELALTFLRSLCERIEEVYPPGARILICSDGRVFSDLIGVNDEHVTAYRQALDTMIKRLGGGRLKQFTLDDACAGTGNGPEEMRSALTSMCPRSLEGFKELVRSDEKLTGLYRGITRFMFEDRRTPDYTGSRAALQRASRERAYGVMYRSKAWGTLLDKLFPAAVRLSIHPQPCSSPKIGILLAGTPDMWLTPWHSVAVGVGDRFTLMHRAEAEAAGARLIYREGRPSHYVLEPAAEPVPVPIADQDPVTAHAVSVRG